MIDKSRQEKTSIKLLSLMARKNVNAYNCLIVCHLDINMNRNTYSSKQ